MKKNRRKLRESELREEITSYLFLSPYLILFTTFIVIPVILALLLSFTNFDTVNFPKFIGLKNYITLLTTDNTFMQYVLPNTIKFSLIVGPVGYFMSFLYYSLMLYLYYFNDLTGAALSSVIFAVVTFLGSLLSMHLPVIWYGLGFTIASLCAFTFSYFRLRWIEKRLDHFIFCRGSILEKGVGERPSSLVFSR